MKAQEKDSHVRSEEAGKREPGEGSRDNGGLGLPDDRILGEISHEMGNYFHKLYYWTDYLKGSTNGRGPTHRGAVEMLESTVEHLERFMRMTIEYFAPARLSFNSVPVAAIVGGLDCLLAGRQVLVCGLEKWEKTTVLADTALIGHAVRTVFERVADTLVEEDALSVRLSEARRREFRGIEIEFVAGKAIPGTTCLKQGIEIAVAEKFLQMHGGELFEKRAENHSLVIFLPIYP